MTQAQAQFLTNERGMKIKEHQYSLCHPLVVTYSQYNMRGLGAIDPRARQLARNIPRGCQCSQISAEGLTGPGGIPTLEDSADYV